MNSNHHLQASAWLRIHQAGPSGLMNPRSYQVLQVWLYSSTCRANGTQWCFNMQSQWHTVVFHACRANETQWCFTQEAILGEVTSLRIASFFYFKLSHHCVGFFHKKRKKDHRDHAIRRFQPHFVHNKLEKKKRKARKRARPLLILWLPSRKEEKENSYTSVIQIKNVTPPFQKESTQRKQISRACYKAPHEHKDIFSVTRESFAQSEKRNLSEKSLTAWNSKTSWCACGASYMTVNKIATSQWYPKTQRRLKKRKTSHPPTDHPQKVFIRHEIIFKVAKNCENFRNSPSNANDNSRHVPFGKKIIEEKTVPIMALSLQYEYWDK